MNFRYVLPFLFVPCLANAQAVPGVDDYVTCVRSGQPHSNAIQFQTANGGGDTVHHRCISTATWFCIGMSPVVTVGQHTMGQGVASSVAVGTIKNSGYAGGPNGPFIQFSDAGEGFYSDCESNEHGILTIDEP
jgi:hypothetical protein